ncbi:MAG: hypothetical protein ABI895_14390 [Deltaproteobacteria bacterium]
MRHRLRPKIEGSAVHGTGPVYLARAALGLLLAGVCAWCALSSAPGRSTHWSIEPARISPEVSRSPRPARGAPEPSPLIRSIEITRPSAAELRVIASPPRERRQVESALPLCDAPPRTLLRAGCPEAPPEVGPCADEGKDCRYPTADGCVAQYECLYGLWSPLAVTCPDAEPGQLLSGSGQCEANTPVADAPCAQEGVFCGHRSCGFRGITAVVAECRCGRWYLLGQQCPTTR